MNLSIKHVNVYMVDRCYGGPEEGGWWFEYGIPAEPYELEPLPLPVGPTVDWQQRFDLLVVACNELNSERPSISHTNSQGEYMVCIEDHSPQTFPQERPYYC